ncbi:TPA: HNH endonuclease [Yersinia enterocolitica]|nr:HNH endonuclease [Yersinia enterocolitica]HDL6705415.1 HNH endonuclease [Yersinia enterocolitica]HEN3234652.1 HNH endonuclease [Yersinia enterocolitica]HEN3330109.1 HNH endonuclease [Yersinia enterocolitica]HEN3408308.1 HNH endonuclease [Yersinia enterocolitica]
MSLYKILKPISFVIYSNIEELLAQKLNQFGSASWDKGIKDGVNFDRGEVTARNNLKKKIKEYLKTSQNNHCYYCGISFSFFKDKDRNIHVDHILPKNAKHGRYNQYVFEPRNLVLACPICNGVDIKGTLDFAENQSSQYINIRLSIVHPYFEDITEHLRIDQSTGVVILIHLDKRKGKKMEEIFKFNDSTAIRIRLGDILFSRKIINDAMMLETENVLTSIPTNGRLSQ